MEYALQIRAAHADPRGLEEAYQAARQNDDEQAFATALLACHQESPDNLLYAAWYYRLQNAGSAGEVKAKESNWKLAVPVSLATGLLFWILSRPALEFPDQMPYLILTWAPAGALAVIAFLALVARSKSRSTFAAAACLLLVSAYVTAFATSKVHQNYRNLMLPHLPLLAWIATGYSILGHRSDKDNRFAFMIKSIEVFITGGLYIGAGGAFVGITIGLFEALGIHPSNEVSRLLYAGGGGLIPVLAVAGVYDPLVRPAAQRFQHGLSRVIHTLMRLFLPLSLLVLLVYLFTIPFRFMEPFRNRDVLIVYNVMLFAVMGLLIGATPLKAEDLSPRLQAALRTGIIAVASLTALISLYALSATVYRTVLGGITMNRLTIIGWNSINIGILLLLLYRQFRRSRAQWIQSLHATFSLGSAAYLIWALFLALAVPLLF